MGRGGCCCRQQFRSKHLSRGHATLFLGAELSGARVCHRQSPGTEAELTTGGEGDLLRAKKEKESKFPSSVVSGEEGGRRRGRGEAEATNDRDPAATSKLFGFRRRGPHSKHTRFRLTGSAESSAGQEWSAGSSRGRKAVRGRGTESHRPPGQQEGRSDSRVSGQIGVWEVPPFPKIHHPRCCQIPKSVLPSYWPALYENILKVTPVDSYNIPGMRGSESTAGLDLRLAQL
ncbi:uncharacterized protein LOC120593766 isoform X2 [Pteropus medius]|uniref:uncharacterized protein LOC120593766 isoform X2 n=1 Tax=Pteropus vampyrus TaxID=132908 RepID=UPI00196B0EA2|nr:uncharacterized protein LOC120593766 isoform X2 [Pteropus giganteus]